MSVRDLGDCEDNWYSDDTDDEYVSDRDYDHEDEDSGQESGQDCEEQDNEDDEEEEDEEEGEIEGEEEEREVQNVQKRYNHMAHHVSASHMGTRNYEHAASGPSGTSAAIITTTPGHTPYKVSLARDIISTLRLLFTPEIEKLILEMTNLEGSHRQ